MRPNVLLWLLLLLRSWMMVRLNRFVERSSQNGLTGGSGDGRGPRSRSFILAALLRRCRRRYLRKIENSSYSHDRLALTRANNRTAGGGDGDETRRRPKDRACRIGIHWKHEKIWRSNGVTSNNAQRRPHPSRVQPPSPPKGEMNIFHIVSRP